MAGLYKCTKKGAGGSSMPDFQTAETDTGIKWIDGKNIYCRIFKYTTALSVSSVSTIANVSYIDKLINMKAFYANNGTNSIYGIYTTGGDLRISVIPAGTTQTINRIIVYYTKP